MSYIGSTSTTQNFIAGTDQFTGNGSSTNWTLSRFVNSTNDIEVVIANVVQNPTSYSVSGNTLTISPAVSNGVAFYVRYLSTTLQSVGVGDLSVSTGKIQDSAVTTAKIANSAVTPTKLSQPLTLGTAVTASGTAVDFTGIPSWAKRITVMFNGISSASTGNNFQIQIGSSSGIENTGYTQFSGFMNTASANGNSAAATGFFIANWGTAVIHSGSLIFTNLTSNIWTAMGVFGSANGGNWVGGSKTVGGVLDRVRVTINGTDTFDAGTINIMYEG